MNPDEYAAQQAVISAATANYVLRFSQFFTQSLLSITEWLSLLEFLFPEIKRRREESADLARRFYDSQREFYHPLLDRNERFLEDYEFQWFVENMEPVRKVMSQKDAPAHAVASMALRSIREVENAGRRQIIHAVENDPAPQIIKGWARVATGRETCAWCLMLISRGPVYQAASTAGLDLDDTSARQALVRNEDVSEFMEEWHDGCDCKVVPVFKTEDWFGQEAADRALELWTDATREAVSLEDKGLVHKAGKKKGRPFTRNELAMNALRRRLENGDITTSEWSALAAA